MSESNAQSIKKILQENAIQVLGILVILLNLWLATKLSPLQQSIALIVQKVDALEIYSDNHVPRTEIEVRFDDIKDQLDRIENKF